jgi:penicillin-binding protein 1A
MCARSTTAPPRPIAAARLGVQIVRLSRRARSRLQARRHRPDEPITINGWSPRNNSRTFAGQVPLRQAFAQSINTVSVRLAQEVGFRTVADMAQRFGITTPVVTHPSMALGSSEVRLIDMTRAFASVAARGVAVVPTASSG